MKAWPHPPKTVAAAVLLVLISVRVSFVWATCESPDPPNTAASLPIRIDGAKLTLAGDGAVYSETVREMFPEDLADLVLNNPDSPDVRP